MMRHEEGNDDDSDSDGSSLLLSPDHHETPPLPFHVLLLFYDCDPFLTLPPPLPRPLPFFPENPAVSSRLISAYPYWNII